MKNKIAEASPLPPLIGGVMIIVATIIGAGMLAMPIATSGVWFWIGVVVLSLSWLAMTYSGLMLFEVNLHYPQGSSYNTIVKDLLGPFYNIIVGLCIVFVLYTLMYAYITVGVSISLDSFKNIMPVTSQWNRVIMTVIFTLFFAFFIWLSISAVDKVSTFIVGIMLISFILLISQSLPHIRLEYLLDKTVSQYHYPYRSYLLLAFPVCLAAFGFHGTIPSLVKYYQGNVPKVKYSIILGSLLALIIYIVWLLVVQGNLPRDEVIAIYLSGQDEIVLLINSLANYIHTNSIKSIINLFGYLAIISSFLGVALGLFDYIMDLFSLPENKNGRLMAAMITFLPPMLASIFFPYGFVKAIAYVGFAAAIWAVIIPVLLVYRARGKFSYRGQPVFGNKLILAYVFLFGLINIIAMLAIEFNWTLDFLLK